MINAYGPTETTVCASMYVCDPREEKNPAIGRPMRNVQIYILDGHRQPVPIGVVIGPFRATRLRRMLSRT